MFRILSKLIPRNNFHLPKRSFCIEKSQKVYSDEEKLLRELCSKIRFSGPITIAEYMREVLTNPIHGFYIDKEVLGSGGHFVTSPEISQMFGESIGVWLLNEWMKMGEPSNFQLVELGPGSGTLISDILRTFAKLKPECAEGLSLHLVEISPRMRKLQKESLGCNVDSNDTNLITKYGTRVSWYEQLREVPRNFTFFLAHEFFDALAVNKFQKVDNEWREVLIDVDEAGNKLRYIISRNATPGCILLERDGVKEAVMNRNMVEMSSPSWTIIRQISERIVEKGGAALVADYGHTGQDGDTFRAFRHHKQVDPLQMPGTADITADVDFSLLKTQISPDCTWHGPVSQGQFLHSCGIGTRCQQLLSSCDSSQQQLIYDSFVMLTSPEKMGERFKFVSLFPSTMADIHEKYPPVGFEK